MKSCIGSDYEVYTLINQLEMNGFTVKRGSDHYYFWAFYDGRKVYTAFARDEFRQHYTVRYDPEYFGSMKLH